jgi:hypothetical protein
MPNWSTQLFAEYELSTQDANLSGSQSFTLAGTGNPLLSPQYGEVDFTMTPASVLVKFIDSGNVSFTLVPATVSYGFTDSGTISFILFPQGTGLVSALKTTKDGLYNVTIK